jgi:uncharacterized protein (DUF1330 family)
MLRTLGVLAAGLLLGVGATQMLHQAEAFQTAQAAAAKPLGYVVFEVDVKDRDGYSNVFLPDAYKGIHAHGGKLMAGGYDKGVSLAGIPTANRVGILAFPNVDEAKIWFQEQEKLRREVAAKFADFRIYAVEGVEAK